jgi:hypothetical protein
MAAYSAAIRASIALQGCVVISDVYCYVIDITRLPFQGSISRQLSQCRDKATGSATGVRLPVGQGSSICLCVQTSSGAHPASCIVCMWVLSSALKRPERETRHVMSRLIMRGAVHPVSHMSARCDACFSTRCSCTL